MGDIEIPCKAALQGSFFLDICHAFQRAFMELQCQKQPAGDTGQGLFSGGSEIDDIRNVAHIAVGK